MQKNKSKRNILIGALLVVGLFFIMKEKTELLSVENIKPSQLDFKLSNQVLPPANQVEVKEKTETEKVPTTKLPEKDLRAWNAFEEILKSKNDNDPRMDRELKTTSDDFHEALFERYDALLPENRNGRGLIAFLVARDLKSPADAEFLKKIYQESPCTSFENCNNVDSEDAHFSGINQTSLNYPQLAGLYQIEARLSYAPEILKNINLRDGIAATLRRAADFPVPVVRQKAEEIKSRYGL